MNQQPRESKIPGQQHEAEAQTDAQASSTEASSTDVSSTDVSSTDKSAQSYVAGADQSSSPDADPAAPESGSPPAQNIPFMRVVTSVLQASFGVQSRENRERDFVHGKALPFIVAALVFTVLFVAILMVVVNLVLP